MAMVSPHCPLETTEAVTAWTQTTWNFGITGIIFRESTGLHSDRPVSRFQIRDKNQSTNNQQSTRNKGK
jgi:hypothetical protein